MKQNKYKCREHVQAHTQTVTHAYDEKNRITAFYKLADDQNTHFKAKRRKFVSFTVYNRYKGVV